MDLVTHVLLGATLGRAFFAKRLGRRAMGWGALANVAPDLDMLVALFGPFEAFRYHRSLTHALWFGPLVGPLAGFMMWRARGGREGRNAVSDVDSTGERAALGKKREPQSSGRDALFAWAGLFTVALLSHPLLDVFTTYGTQLLWPMSRHRFALDAVAIIDPAYTLVLLLGLVVPSWAPGCATVGPRAAVCCLLLSTGYLFYGLRLNEKAEAEALTQLTASGHTPERVRAYPTLLQVWLRRLVARGENEVRVGYISMWRPGRVSWHRLAIPSHPSIERLRQSEEGRLFEWFTSGETFPHVKEVGGGVIVEIDDMRYSFGPDLERGSWGISAFFDDDDAGRSMGEVRRFIRPPMGFKGSLAFLWRATFLTEAR